jgi:hypothetical protein
MSVPAQIREMLRVDGRSEARRAGSKSKMGAYGRDIFKDYRKGEMESNDF